MRHLIHGVIALLSTGIAGSALADGLACQARVGLSLVYTVEADLDSGLLEVTTDSGYSFSGQANKTVSGRTGNTILYLATGHESGIEVEVESGGAERVALCLAASECYLCRR